MICKTRSRLIQLHSKPTATSATPATAAGATPTAITNFAGTGFVTGAKLSIFNTTTNVEVPCTANGFTSSTQITGTTPVVAAGTYQMVARNPDGEVASVAFVMT